MPAKRIPNNDADWLSLLIDQLRDRVSVLESAIRLHRMDSDGTEEDLLLYAVLPETLRPKRIFIGRDSMEVEASDVAAFSIRKQDPLAPESRSLELEDLRGAGIYKRPTSVRNGQLWDDISEASMSTEHAIARFFIRFISSGWALFMDGDVFLRRPVSELFRLADPRYAVMVVKHPPMVGSGLKKEGAVQSPYPRKNWSSVMLINGDHPANRRLTLDMLNTVPGRDLHRFCWLEDQEIGELPPEWNWLVGHSDPSIEPALVHFTEGMPDLPGYQDVPYAAEWRAMRERMHGAIAEPVGV